MTIREVLAQENPDALFYPDQYDAALVGRTVGFGPKSDRKPGAVYDHDKLVEILAAQFAEDARRDGDDSDEEELLAQAEEWIDYNMAGAFLGPSAPVIVAIAGTVLASDLEVCLVPDCEDAGTHHAPGGSKSQQLCCEHYEQFAALLLDPIRNTRFPL